MTLVKMVQTNGAKNWSKIAKFIPGRIGKQCRERLIIVINRWYNHLSPNIKKEKWTEEEDQIIIKAHKM